MYSKKNLHPSLPVSHPVPLPGGNHYFLGIFQTYLYVYISIYAHIFLGFVSIFTQNLYTVLQVAIFLIMALLRYNSYTTQPTHLKYNLMAFSVFKTEIYQHIRHYHEFQNILITPKRNSIPISSHSLFSPDPLPQPQETANLLCSLQICLLQTFPINRIIQYELF